MSGGFDDLSLINDLLSGTVTTWQTTFWEKPVTIEEFATSPEHMRGVPFTPRQLAAITGWLGNDPLTIFDKHSPRKNLAVYCYGKGCLLPSSTIQLADGRRASVQELLDGQIEPELTSYDQDSHVLLTAKASVPFHRGKGRCLRVKLKSGRFVDVFEEHLFFISKAGFYAGKHNTKTWQWSAAKDCKPGQYIAVPERVIVPGSVSAPLEARYVGYLLGDGSYTFADGESAQAKTVPAECFKYDEASVRELLSGLWMTDGWISRPRNPTNRAATASWQVGYASISEQLCRDIVDLWHRLGVVARIARTTKTYKGSPYPVWTVSITERRYVLRALQALRLVGPKLAASERALSELSAAPTSGKGVYKRDGVVYWDRIESIEELGEHDYYDLTVEGPETYVANGMLHHNSGKNMIATVTQAYLFYVLLCMRNPLNYFGFPAGESIDMINVASSAAQAKRNYFDKLTRRVLNWRWLQQHFDVHKAGKLVSEPQGKSHGRINITEDSIEWNGGIKCISAHSDSKGYEGYSVVYWCMDEASSWETEYIQSESGEQIAVSKAHSIFDTLRTSAVSRSWKWAGLVISYPRQEDDFTLGLATDILDGKTEGFADIAATWEVKPMHLWTSQETFEHKIERPWGTRLIYPPKDFEQEFKLYPTQSELKYACVPSRTQAYFIYNDLKIHECAKEDIKPLCTLKRIEIVSHNASTSKETRYWGYDLLDIKDPNSDYDYYCHVDLAVSKDMAVVGIGHGEPFAAQVLLAREDGEMEHEQLTKKVVIDQLITWEPDSRHLISHLNVDEILKRLDERYRFRYLSYDQYNSNYVLEKAIRRGRNAGQHNVNNRDYFLLRSLIFANAISYPKSDVLLTELSKLIWTGKRVDHTPHYSKDHSDVIAAIARNIISGEGEKRQKIRFHFS